MLPLQPAVFAIITALIEQRSGLVYKREDSDLLASKMSPRARELGFDLLLDYYYYLRHDPAGRGELDQLIESLAIHETYFFREPEQLTLLVDTFLAPMVKSGLRPRVWCCASASGEEPYTLAMLLGERDLIRSVELIASDLSARMLAQAQEGVYSGRALRSIAGTVATRWLEGTGTKVQISSDLRYAIDWRQINLIDPAQVAALGQFDAILCRNVLIYFGDQTTNRVLEQLTAALKNEGLLLVGAAESLIHSGTSLICEERSRSFFYRKSG